MANCAACGLELKAVEPTTPDSESTYQFDNALWIGFFGGYSMFVDDIDRSFGHSAPMLEGAAEEAVICHDCAHELCERMPWIGNLLKPWLSHAHSKEFWEKNPHHVGWDRPDLSGESPTDAEQR